MREIKFRAWKERDHKFYYFGLFESDGDYLLGPGISINTSLGDAVMQYIDRKDKSGREIYGGDIIAIYNLYEKDYDVEVVEWDYKITGWSPFTERFWDVDVYYDIENVKVIGNIYETPEKLKGQTNG